MSRYIWGGWNNGGANLLTIPDNDSAPKSWSNELLASARGEINYLLTDPRLTKDTLSKLEELRREIEIQIRSRLNVKESPEEFAARCLFHECKINYRTGDRKAKR